MSTPFALLFSGQGAQTTGMGRDVAEASRDAMDLWKKAESLSGMDLRSIYWESDDATAMADTRCLQPALTVVELTLWQFLAAQFERKGFHPVCVAGHSLGEYAALVAAGAIAANTALELVSLRGALMAEADPDGLGAMAAVVKLSLPVVEQIVQDVQGELGQEETLLIANYNTPGQFVLSGTKAAITAATAHVKNHKGRAVPLAVSGAFHSPLMAKAGRKLAEVLEKATWATPRLPVYCNTLGCAVQEKQRLKAEVCRQMTSSVLWINTLQNQWTDGVRHWIELGPKPVLSRMVAPILETLSPAPTADMYSVHSVGSLEDFDEFNR